MVNWSVAIRVMQLAVLIAVLKFLSHMFGFDLMEINALFTSQVAGTIFLIGFLISRVLSDYKESEKIPSEMGASTKTMIDNTFTIYKTKQSAMAPDLLNFRSHFAPH